ncbi:MAG: peptidase [Acidobacteria bacterium]|nr:peptidase [Acidobacteriota bacterium]
MTMTRRTRRLALALVLACGGLASPGAAPQEQAPAQPAGPSPATRAVRQERIDAASVRAAIGLDSFLPRRSDSIARVLSTTFDPARAMDVVTFMDRFWRESGNSGYAASLERIEAELIAGGFADGRTAAASPRLWTEEYPKGGNGWEAVRFAMTILEGETGPSEQVFDPVVDYIAICMNSFSTPAGGLTARLVYVGEGTRPEDYAAVEVKGAVVLADGGVRRVWQEAVQARGAAGVVFAEVPPDYTRPAESPEVFQWGGVPYDEKAGAFGFTASPLVAGRLKDRLRKGAVTVKVEVETTFHPSPGRLLVAEIPGTVRPAERVVMVAHVQEPGANDNASGCATLLELARALRSAVRSKALPAPGRTLTFIWGDEMRASREWLRAGAGRSASTRAMISLDMTGEDAAKTGGTFIIEKQPDPSAVWPRPSDPHTEWWGGGSYQRALKGSYLNDLLLAVCLRRARETGWVVQTNPYEGGSDHTIFLNAGIPALLVSHFTDRYYHTNLDRADKVSPAEMAHVAVSVGTTAMLIASAGDEEARAVADLVADAARRRLELEARQSAELIAGASDRAAAEAGERVLHDAWRAWYGDALGSVLALPLRPAGKALRARVDAAARALRGPEAGARR